MNSGYRAVVLAGMLIAMCAALREPSASAQSNDSPATSPGSEKSSLTLQRSAAIYNFKTTAESGALRGQEIYFFKCWICHNTYTVTEKTGAVSLKGLYNRARLATTGEPVSDRTVAEKIKNGSSKMPAYRHVLKDADLMDLLSYLRDETCCMDDEPPRNPWYRY